MIPRADFHVHTSFCDGIAGIKEFAERALDMGFIAIGFSGHSYTPFDQSYCMGERETERYCSEVYALKNEYYKKLDVLLGIEKDLFSEVEAENYDYIIHSIHYIKHGEEYLPVDESPEIYREIVGSYFDGDVLAYAEAYYSQYEEMEFCGVRNIIGHFDLITKFHENIRLFDEADVRYQKIAGDALEKIFTKCGLLEINTGAMSRNYRSTPYPAEFLLKIWHELGGAVILSGDSHSPDTLGFGFQQAAELAKKCGFKTARVFRMHGDEEVEL